MFYPGTPSHDDFVGTADDDTFDLSTGGSDTAQGRGGDDTFSMVSALNAGDRLDGGNGHDEVDLYGNYNLTFQAATMTGVERLALDGNFIFGLTMNDANVGAGRQLAVEVLSTGAILNFHGGQESNGSFFIQSLDSNDQIFAGAGNDYLYGGLGANTVNGGAGNDYIVSDGVDTIDGGIGYDYVRIDRGASGTNLTFHMNSVGSLTHLQGDGTAVKNAEEIDLIGGTGNDSFIMADGNDGLSGGDGNDTLNGGGGRDNLSGDGGDNTLDGGSGDDFINAEDTDTVDGGTGYDILSIDLSSLSTGVTFNFTNPMHTTTFQGAGTAVTRVEAFTIYGGSGGDHFTTGDGNDNLHGGDFGGNLLSSGGGNDYLEAGGGHNELYGGSGDDHLGSVGVFDKLNGGSEFDLASIDRQTATANLIFHLNNPSHTTTIVGDGTTVKNVEQFEIHGGSGNDRFTTGAGADYLYGGTGNDTLNGGKHDDHLEGGTGDDTINGGSGNDTASYANAAAGVVANLATGTASGDGADTLINIENLIGSDSFDYLFGDSGDNFLNGLRGPDKLNGRGGNDTANIDRYDAVTGLTFNMTNSAHVTKLIGDGMTVKNIENIQIDGGDGNDDFTTGDGDDSLSGGGGHNTLNGGAGDDYLSSQSVDVLNGGSGNDGAILEAPGSNNDLVFNETSSTSTTVLEGAGTTVKNCEFFYLIGGDGNDRFTTLGGDDNLYGGDGNDIFSSGGGDDLLAGLAGADSMNGGSGHDVYYYQSVGDSSGVASHDTIIGFDAREDQFDVTWGVTGVNTAVTSGTLNISAFDSDLAAALHNHLDANHAVVFTPNHGGLQGDTYLVVDANGVAGYQAGADLVVELKNAVHLADLDKGDFIRHLLLG